MIISSLNTKYTDKSGNEYNNGYCKLNIYLNYKKLLYNFYCMLNLNLQPSYSIRHIVALKA